jgi:hypothetical protein
VGVLRYLAFLFWPQLTHGAIPYSTGAMPRGKRHSVGLPGRGLFDAAHLFVVEAKSDRQVGLPKPMLSTVFEIVTGGKVYR